MSHAFAPAKINLYLHVTGRRRDGYHLLDSLLIFANLGDHIDVMESEHLSLEIIGPFAQGLSTGKDNLVLRAARSLADSAGIEPRAAIRLTKNLPVASGIGGGSADGAAALRALVRHWRLTPAHDNLQRLALSLGADVPACLTSQSCYIGGIGEELAPAPELPPVSLVLVNPGVAVSTPEVFQARAAPFSQNARLETDPEIAPKTAAGLAHLLSLRQNDLTDPAMKLMPAVADALRTLTISDGVLLARMSGSGATCFGLFANMETAAAAAYRLQKERPNWWVQIASTLGTETPP